VRRCHGGAGGRRCRASCAAVRRHLATIRGRGRLRPGSLSPATRPGGSEIEMPTPRARSSSPSASRSSSQYLAWRPRTDPNWPGRSHPRISAPTAGEGVRSPAPADRWWLGPCAPSMSMPGLRMSPSDATASAAATRVPDDGPARCARREVYDSSRSRTGRGCALTLVAQLGGLERALSPIVQRASMTAESPTSSRISTRILEDDRLRA